MNNINDIVNLMLEVIDKQDFTMPVNGTSMEPLLHSQNYVTLRKQMVYKKNDVVFYKRTDGTYVLHRIYKKKKDCFVMLGDHQVKTEFPLYENQIIAKMIAYKINNKTYSIKRLKYKFYVLLWRSIIIRKIYFRLKRV